MNLFAPVAVWGFWVLLGVGWMLGELHLKGTAIFILFWLVGFIASRFGFYGTLFTPYVAVLDIVLVLTVFKSDVRLR